ncbi:MAG: general secretion pathway protein A [Alteromonadaceae bacterium]|jgi:general secretion pathway protein A
MYTAYFGLKEKPFSIAPNPQYLFMSDRHREALAHLTYGLGDTGGFVLLTGEVGTGKTTISRCVMEQLPENTQAAFILNPTLSSQELLATICDELKIRYRKVGATLKTLTDKIQEKLLKNHKANINTLLIIDEAQHLQPEVLEQLRLLTNLETNTKKLLQVILIGQPELQTLLKRRDLRQLAQRITARYHLLPLNQQEVSLYIKHRLSVAQCFRELLSAQAMAVVHQISQGIPRLINLVCERALINAYSSNNTLITKKAIVVAAQEALGEDYHLAPWWHHRSVKILAASTLLFVLVFSGYYVGQVKQSTVLVTQSIPSTEVNISNNVTGENSPPFDEKHIKEEKDLALKSKNKDTKDQVNSELTVIVESSNNPSKSAKDVAELATEKRIVKDILVVSVNQEKVENLGLTNTENKEISAKAEYKINAMEGVSDDLLSRFQEAIDETGDYKEKNTAEIATSESLATLADMPQWLQKSLPKLEFTLHIYASDGASWVTVNGRDRYEGDYIDRELLLSEIHPQKVVLNFRGEKFTMAALSSW